MTGTKNILQLIRWLLLAIVVAGGVWYAVRRPELLSALKGVPPASLLAILALELLGKLLQGYKFRLMTGVFGINLRFREWFGLTACASLYSYLLPARAGAGVQAVYLKKQHAFPFAHFGALVAATNALTLVVAGAVGLCASALHLATGRAPAPTLLFVFLGLFVLSLAACVLLAVLTGLVRYVPTQALRRIASDVGDGLRMLAGRRDVLWKVGGLHIVHLVSGGALYYVAFSALGMSVDLTEAVAVAALSAFAMFLALTPASLGINEGVVSAAGHLLGLSADKAMLAALVHRGVSVVATFGLGWVYSHVLLGGVFRGLGPGAEKSGEVEP